MAKTTFTFPIINDTTPMNTDPFYAFIGTCTLNDLFVPTMMAYLETLGFDHDENIISEEDTKSLRYIFQHWHDMKTLLPPHKIEDLFTTEDPRVARPVSVQFCAKNKSIKYNEAPILENAINHHRHGGYSYKVQTSADGTVYLFMIYSQIIGSVRVCEVIQE